MKQSWDDVDQRDSSRTRDERSCNLQNRLHQHNKKRMRTIGPYRYEVRQAAQHDESTELDNNPPKWKHIGKTDKVDKLQRN